MSNWTIGSDDDYDLLYEQHNPDYIPTHDGGPSVLIADSENNRIIEFQRSNDNWSKAWVWSDSQMEWPRDADRLPNGNTLIADTHSDRLLEVTPSDEIVWQVRYPKPYEVERLDTGDESKNGHSAHQLGYTNQTMTNGQIDVKDSSSVKNAISNIIPNKLKHGILWVAPAWMSFFDILLSAVATGLFILLISAEIWHTDKIELQMPLQVR